MIENWDEPTKSRKRATNRLERHCVCGMPRQISGFWEAAWGRGGVRFFFVCGNWNVEFGWFLELFVLVSPILGLPDWSHFNRLVGLVR